MSEESAEGRWAGLGTQLWAGRAGKGGIRRPEGDVQGRRRVSGPAGWRQLHPPDPDTAGTEGLDMWARGEPKSPELTPFEKARGQARLPCGHKHFKARKPGLQAPTPPAWRFFCQPLWLTSRRGSERWGHCGKARHAVPGDGGGGAGGVPPWSLQGAWTWQTRVQQRREAGGCQLRPYQRVVPVGTGRKHRGGRGGAEV